jgi:serine protease
MTVRRSVRRLVRRWIWTAAARLVLHGAAQPSVADAIALLMSIALRATLERDVLGDKDWRRARRVLVSGIALMILFSADVLAENNGRFPVRRQGEIARILVKWHSSSSTKIATQSATDRVRNLSASTGLHLQFVRDISPMLTLLKLGQPLSGVALDQMLEQVAHDATVEYVTPDFRRWPHATPSDSLFGGQWYLQSSELAAIKANAAWDTTTGSAGTVVAVVDTGVRYGHPDLKRAGSAGKLLQGYDFVTDTSSANDGDGRDDDASDPGDWVDSGDIQQPEFAGCSTSDSSWHGTRVSGIIGALTDNGIGIAATSWSTWILPVRVLGKCGGYDSDILEGMRWAAGLEVTDVETNPNPANIINISLGADTSCPPSYADVVAEIGAHGVLVIASAGNDGSNVDAPANCRAVVAVAGLRHAGTKVGFSSLGTDVDIGAPAGNCVNSGAGEPCLYSIDTTTDVGTTEPAGSDYTDQYNYNVGTSFSAPIVAGTVGLMHAVNARLGPELLTRRLQAAATAFPVPAQEPAGGTCHVPSGDSLDVQSEECVCTTETCGAGMVDTEAAVAEAQRPVVSIVLPAGVGPGETLQIDASASSAACDRSLTTFEWSIVAASGSSPVIEDMDESVVTVEAPTNGEFTLRLIVTDDAGLQDIADTTIASSSVSTTANLPLDVDPCPIVINVSEDEDEEGGSRGLGSSGGGGTSGVELLFLGALLLIARRGREMMLFVASHVVHPGQPWDPRRRPMP